MLMNLIMVLLPLTQAMAIFNIIVNYLDTYILKNFNNFFF